MLKLYLDRSPIHIIKSKVVQVGERHLRVSFLYEKIPTQGEVNPENGTPIKTPKPLVP